MAYMSQEDKAKIAAALKKVMPAHVKYTLSVRHNSTICMTIKSAAVDFIGNAAKFSQYVKADQGHCDANHYHLENSFDGEALEILQAANEALHSADFYDHSDSQTDYFNCAYYVDIKIGKYNKPFVFVKSAAAQAVTAAESEYSALMSRLKVNA